jgi:hypothetical protein
MVRIIHLQLQTSIASDFACDTDSDSDDSIEELTNRGNKLKRKSRFVREGQLAPPTGPQVYRKVRIQNRNQICYW